MKDGSEARAEIRSGGPCLLPGGALAARGGEELFAIPRGPDRYYLYAPLRRSVAVVNGAAVAAVAAHLGDEPLAAGAAATIEALRAQGMLGAPRPEAPRFPTDFAFRPHEVTLFPTSRCNLRCRYCYADAGRKALDMPWEVARAAVDLVAENAGLLGTEKLDVGFHGGGEPLVAWDLVARVVAHGRAKAEALGLDVDFYAATNGLLSPGQRAFVRDKFATVNVSLDGPPDVQDRNRPTRDGGGSRSPEEARGRRACPGRGGSAHLRRRGRRALRPARAGDLLRAAERRRRRERVLV